MYRRHNENENEILSHTGRVKMEQMQGQLISGQTSPYNVQTRGEMSSKPSPIPFN